jgi:predicted RNA-binding protein with PIN domain
MGLHIIIDGYNLIRQSEALSPIDHLSLQAGRETLIDLLAAYKREKKHPVTVVFDGANAPPFSKRQDRVQGIDIIFSRNGELADAVIKRIAGREKERAVVVSSDAAVSHDATVFGAATISSSDFGKMMASAIDSADIAHKGDAHEGWKPSTRKKGPSRKLSRRRRKNLLKLKKL